MTGLYNITYWLYNITLVEQYHPLVVQYHVGGIIPHLALFGTP